MEWVLLALVLVFKEPCRTSRGLELVDRAMRRG